LRKIGIVVAPLHLASGFFACSFGVLFVSVETPPPLLILFQDKYVKVSIMLAILPRKKFKPAATIVSATVKSSRAATLHLYPKHWFQRAQVSLTCVSWCFREHQEMKWSLLLSLRVDNLVLAAVA
jgi:hypothetical protein